MHCAVFPLLIREQKVFYYHAFNYPLASVLYVEECHNVSCLITHFPTDRAVIHTVITFLQSSGQCEQYLLEHLQLLNFLLTFCIIHGVLFRNSSAPGLQLQVTL
ncbi:hypothetical protein XENTR_v10018625 [Xenopus tropicalis]|nr:hypothetical protein XENTR_v10018625 [Xenopus tropicalis]